MGTGRQAVTAGGTAAADRHTECEAVSAASSTREKRMLSTMLHADDAYLLSPPVPAICWVLHPMGGLIIAATAFESIGAAISAQ